MQIAKYIGIFLLLSSFIYTKDPDHIVLTNAEKMVTDNLGNVYLINKSSITKYDRSGVQQKSFSNKKYGPITSADASNPLRIVLYYRDFGRVIFLDNMLAQIGDEVKLEVRGYPQTTAVASSHDDGLWIFDQQNFELIRFNRNLEIENRSGNLSQVIGKNVHANFIVEKGNWLYVNDTTSGVYLFDVYGTYSRLIPEKITDHFQVSNDAIVHFEKDGMVTIPVSIGNKTSYVQPKDSTALDMRIEKDAVFVLKKDTLKIYNRTN